MRIAGIIAEYDPFHKGHEAHIAATRAANGGNATHIVAVMSGNFTQRGQPALLDKFHRAEMALSAGADLVIELPLCWAMAPAEHFANGGIALLKALGCVDLLSFGSECGNVTALQQVAALPSHPAYQTILRQLLSDGIPYAAAGQAAAEEILGVSAAELLASPNNTLGIEYIRAAALQQAEFEFFTLSRQGALHNDDTPADGYASASTIRKSVRSKNEKQAIRYMPDSCGKLLTNAITGGIAPSDQRRLEAALLTQLRRMSCEDFAALPWMSEGLENRLYKCSRTATSIEQLLSDAKTKRYPMARLRRILWAAFLGIRAEDTIGLPPYLRVLGMNERGREILSVSSPTLPIITRAAQIDELDERAQRLYALETVATDLYALSLPNPPACGIDMTHKFIRINEENA